MNICPRFFIMALVKFDPINGRVGNHLSLDWSYAEFLGTARTSSEHQEWCALQLSAPVAPDKPNDGPARSANPDNWASIGLSFTLRL